MNAMCQNIDHHGDRLVDRRDLFERRIEWRRVTDQHSEWIRTTRRECRACARREVEDSTAPIPGQVTLL